MTRAEIDLSATEDGKPVDLSELRLEPEDKLPRAPRRRPAFAAFVLGVVVVAATVVTLVVLERPSPPGVAPTGAPAAPPALVPSADRISAGGYVDALRSANLLPALSGVVRRVYVALGQRVEAVWEDEDGSTD